MKVVMKVSVSIITYAKVWENVDNYRKLSYRYGGGSVLPSILGISCSFYCFSSLTEEPASKGCSAWL